MLTSTLNFGGRGSKPSYNVSWCYISILNLNLQYFLLPPIQHTYFTQSSSDSTCFYQAFLVKWLGYSTVVQRSTKQLSIISIPCRDVFLLLECVLGCLCERASERVSDGWGVRARSLLSLSATNTIRATAPAFCYINWEPGYILLAGIYNRHNRPEPDVQPAGRRVQPLQPDWFLRQKNHLLFFS